MSVFIVLLDEGGNEAVKKRLHEEYEGAYAYHANDRVIFVRTNDIAENVAVKIGIKGDKKVADATGAVFRINSSYAGYTQNSLWDWLSQNEQTT